MHVIYTLNTEVKLRQVTDVLDVNKLGGRCSQ